MPSRTSLIRQAPEDHRKDALRGPRVQALSYGRGIPLIDFPEGLRARSLEWIAEYEPTVPAAARVAVVPASNRISDLPDRGGDQVVVKLLGG